MTDYTELHTHSCYSLLDGASSPSDLCTRAAELGYSTLALTDHDAVYGAIDFVQAAQKHNVRPILGAELTLHDDSHLTLLVKDARGWHNLCTLITLARHNAPKGEAGLPEGVLLDHTQGLIALSGCRNGTIPQAIARQDYRGHPTRLWPTVMRLAKIISTSSYNGMDYPVKSDWCVIWLHWHNTWESP